MIKFYYVLGIDTTHFPNTHQNKLDEVITLLKNSKKETGEFQLKTEVSLELIFEKLSLLLGESPAHEKTDKFNESFQFPIKTEVEMNNLDKALRDDQQFRRYLVRAPM